MLTLTRGKWVSVAMVPGLLMVGRLSNAETYIIPDLTSGGTATENGSAFGDGAPSNAFDDNASTKAGTVINLANGPFYLQYNFAAGAAYRVLSYSITSANDDYGRDPATFTLQGSNDNFATITTVDTETGVAFPSRFDTEFFTVANPGALTDTFSSYRLAVTANTGGGEVQLAELQLFPTVVPEPASLGLAGLGCLGLLARRRRAGC